MKFFQQIWNDIKKGENIDVYLTLAFAIIIGLISLVGLAREYVSPLTLAVLALLAYVILGSRRRIEDLAETVSTTSAASSDSFILSRRPDLEERLRNAKSIAINGITLARTSDSYLTIFRNCFLQGGNVRLLIVDPNHPALEIAGKRFYKHQDISKLRREVDHTLDNFETLLSQRKSAKQCQIGFLQAMPPYGIWLIDVDGPKAEIWVEIYSFQDEVEPTFHLMPSRDGKWFDFFCQQFERMWDTRVPWDEAQHNTPAA